VIIVKYRDSTALE